MAKADKKTQLVSDGMGGFYEIPINVIQVDHPDHYNQGSIECIEALKACMTPEEYRGFCSGNVIKYVWRYRNKNGIKDLKKAKWYLETLIKDLEEAEKNE